MGGLIVGGIICLTNTNLVWIDFKLRLLYDDKK